MKAAIRSIKNHVYSYADIEVKVREATSNDPWRPPESLLIELSRASYDYSDYAKLFSMIWKRLGDIEYVTHVTKALYVLRYLVIHGSDRFLVDVKRRARDIAALQRYTHLDINNMDDAKEARKLAKEIYALLCNDELLKKERQDAVKEKHRSNQHADDDEDEDGDDIETGNEYKNKNKSPFDDPDDEEERGLNRHGGRKSASRDVEEEKRPNRRTARTGHDESADASGRKSSTQDYEKNEKRSSARRHKAHSEDEVEDEFKAVSEEDMDEQPRRTSNKKETKVPRKGPASVDGDRRQDPPQRSKNGQPVRPKKKEADRENDDDDEEEYDSDRNGNKSRRNDRRVLEEDRGEKGRREPKGKATRSKRPQNDSYSEDEEEGSHNLPEARNRRKKGEQQVDEDEDVERNRRRKQPDEDDNDEDYQKPSKGGSSRSQKGMSAEGILNAVPNSGRVSGSSSNPQKKATKSKKNINYSDDEEDDSAIDILRSSSNARKTNTSNQGDIDFLTGRRQSALAPRQTDDEFLASMLSSTNVEEEPALLDQLAPMRIENHSTYQPHPSSANSIHSLPPQRVQAINSVFARPKPTNTLK